MIRLSFKYAAASVYFKFQSAIVLEIKPTIKRSLILITEFHTKNVVAYCCVHLPQLVGEIWV